MLLLVKAYRKFRERSTIHLQVFTLHELKKWNGNKWIHVDKDGTTAYLTTDYIKHLVDSLARNDTDVDELSVEEKDATKILD